MTDFISTKDTAKLVRQELVKVFGKATKFSVTCRDHTCINVGWTDGPTDKEVEKAIGHFKAGDFDSMDDCCKYDGSPYGNRYLFTNRDVSETVWATVRDIMIEKFPQIAEDGWFTLDDGSWHAYNPRIAQTDWDRLYRQAVWNYDAQTGQFIVTDLLNGHTPDNWQHHENPAPEPEPEYTAPAPVVYEPVVIHPVAIGTPKVDIFVTAKFGKLNKQNDIADYYLQMMNPNDYDVERCKIVKIVALSTEGYDTFSHNLLEGFDWLAGEGGGESNEDFPEHLGAWTPAVYERYRATSWLRVVEIRAPARPAIYANPEGNTYARYVGLPA